MSVFILIPSYGAPRARHTPISPHKACSVPYMQLAPIHLACSIHSFGAPHPTPGSEKELVEAATGSFPEQLIETPGRPKEKNRQGDAPGGSRCWEAGAGSRCWALLAAREDAPPGQATPDTRRPLDFSLNFPANLCILPAETGETCSSSSRGFASSSRR